MVITRIKNVRISCPGSRIDGEVVTAAHKPLPRSTNRPTANTLYRYTTPRISTTLIMNSLLPYCHTRSKNQQPHGWNNDVYSFLGAPRTDSGASQPLAAIDPNHQTRAVRGSSRYLYLSGPQLRYIEYYLCRWQHGDYRNRFPSIHRSDRCDTGLVSQPSGY